MASTPRRARLTLLALALAAAPLAAQQARFSPQAIDSLRAQEPARVATAARLLENLRPELGLDARHGFRFTRVLTDDFGQAHARFHQTFQGVRVWGGEFITHQEAEGSFAPHTRALRLGIQLNTTPGLVAEEALAVAHRALAPKGDYTAQPTAELVIYPATATRPSRAIRTVDEILPAGVTPRYHLAYHVHTQLENGTEETRHTDFIIDAHTGAVLDEWNSLRTTDAVGTANTQYSGVKSIHTNLNGGSYELKDVFRPMNISTYNLNHGTGSGTGTLYTDADNTWGDGANYVEGSSTTAANGQTAGVDAHYGIEATYDFFKNVLNRDGIDNANRATYSRVHYSNSYDNAFWSDSCFCMTYGDGNSFTTLTSLDVAGHEMTHGVCSNTANLVYSGEPGGLNESNSDILGNMVELYSANGNTLPNSVSNTDGCWLVGEQLASSPLRYMYKPSKDGGSKDAWYSGIGSIDVHYSSGPNNRMFFFLSQGATTSGDYSTTYLPSGMTGIGPAKATQIWYRALSVYLTSSSNYAAARTACINAAKDLYGAGGAEEAAVWNAYHGINVGAVWNNGDTTSPTCSASEAGSTGTITLSATASDNVAVTKVEFYIDGSLVGTDTSSPYDMAFNSATLADGSHTLVAKAYDAAGNIGTSTSVPFTTTNGTSGYQNEVEGNNTRAKANVVATSGTTVKGYISTTSDTDYFKVTVPAGHTFQAVLTPPSTSDFDLYLYSSNGSQVASSILGTGAVDTASVTNTSASAKVYYARVRYYSGASTVNPYTLKLTF